MVGHNLTSRSLRHLRFARQMTAGQPLLARAIVSAQRDHNRVGPDFVSVNGNQLPVGHIVRYLPRSEPPPTHDIAMRDDMRDEIVPPSIERALRLLPRQPAHEARTDAPQQPDEPPTPEHEPEQAPGQHEPRPSARKPRHAQTGQPPASSERPAPLSDSAHPEPMTGGSRPRSRIVELPGILVVPVAHADDANDSSRASVRHADADERPGSNSADDSHAERSERADISSASSPPPTVEPTPANTADPATSTNPPPRRPRRRGKQSGPPPRRASDDLFVPTDADRSPQTWFARLQQATQQAPAEDTARDSRVPGMPDLPDSENRQAAPTLPRMADGEVPATGGLPRTSGAATSRGAQSTQAAATVERPTVLAETSRRVLYAATGIDPVETPIYRGTAAERLTAAQNADALTDGNSIAMGVGHATDTPETLGLLAHELTHIAQRRRPRFVPPVVQHQVAATPAVSPAVSPADEETQAQWVEARVADAAARALHATPLPTSTDPVTLAEAFAPSMPEPEGQRSPSRSPWGNLPAPWEPLPAWVAAPAEAAPSASASVAPSVPASTGTSNSPSSASQTAAAPHGLASSNAPSTQRAERGRSLPSVEAETSAAATAHEGGTPEPDLDALAQQVHAILKRRLAAERRRFG